MSDSFEQCILSCPLCGTNFCPIFYGFSLLYPNFDNPKRLNIELKYICTQNNNKMSTIELSNYLEMISMNSKFNDYLGNEIIDNKLLKDLNMEEINKNIEKVINNINNILNISKEILNSNNEIINKYINESKECSTIIKYFLFRYIELNNDLFSFINIFLKNVRNFKEDNIKLSFLYIYKLLYYLDNLQNKKLYLTKELIDDFIITNDIMKLPFLIKIDKGNSPCKGREILKGHNLPIVGLTQMRNGLILSGSYGFLKIWKKNIDINNEHYSCFQFLYDVKYNSNLIRCFIELEDNIIAFVKEKQIIEAEIDKNGPIYFKELFQYQIAESSLESLTSINNNTNLVAGLYQKIYIYKRSNPYPIYTLQYHKFFIEQIISIPKLNLFCSSGTDYKVILYNSDNFEFFSAFNFEESHIIGLCNYDQTDFCASTMGGKIWYFKWNKNNNTHEQIGPINAHKKEIYGIRQIENGNVVSVSRDSSIKFWDINKLICICKFEIGPNDLIIQLKDRRLCCASNNMIISIYNNLPVIKDYNMFSIE